MNAETIIAFGAIFLLATLSGVFVSFIAMIVMTDPILPEDFDEYLKYRNKTRNGINT